GDLSEAHEQNVRRPPRKDDGGVHRRHGGKKQGSFRPSRPSSRMLPSPEAFSNTAKPQEVHFRGVIRSVPGAHREQERN
ncbi:hypothetical protein TorRG33x02_083250, partial [Trema orientale]